MIKPPELPQALHGYYAVPMYSPEQVRAIQREAMKAALLAAAELCKKEAKEAYTRYRAEGSSYDDGGCDMANVLETYIRALEIEP